MVRAIVCEGSLGGISETMGGKICDAGRFQAGVKEKGEGVMDEQRKK